MYGEAGAADLEPRWVSSCIEIRGSRRLYLSCGETNLAEPPLDCLRVSYKVVISELPPFFLDLDAPMLAAEAIEVDGRILWRVWCSHCADHHWHGPGEGHRISYCRRPGSPYAVSGYNLAEAAPPRET